MNILKSPGVAHDERTSSQPSSFRTTMKIIPVSHRRTLLISLSVFFLLPALHAQIIPEYTVLKSSTPMKIDGKLTEPEWVAAP